MEENTINKIAFSPCEEPASGEGLSHIMDLYKDMMQIFEEEISPIINAKLVSVLEEGGDNVYDTIKEAAGELVEKDMTQRILHTYLFIYNDFIRAIDAYAGKNELGSLFATNGFEPKRLTLYWYPYYTGNKRSGREPYHRPVSMIQTLSVSFVISNELMGLCHYATSAWNVLKFAYRGSKRLQFTWADYFNYLYATHSSVSTTIVYNVINLMLKGWCKDVTLRTLTTQERIGVAFADFAYGKKVGVTPNVLIDALDIINDADLAGVYDVNEMYLKLEDAFGLRTAVFRYQGEDCVAFAGTRLDFSGVGKGFVSMQNILTDVIQLIYKPTPAYMAAVGIVDAMLSNTSKNVSVYGHSLGGGLMQFACAGNSTTRVHGYGYNSAGLSASTCDILSKRGAYVQLNNIVFINASTDLVSKIGFFLGERVEVDTTGMDALMAHKIETLNAVVNKGGMLYC